MTSVLLVVGDASGDRYAADFVRELRGLRADIRFFGMGGVELEKAGVELVVHQRELAVGGVVELVPHLGRIVRIWRRMAAELERGKPDLVVLVDSSGFNLPFARRAQRAGVPVFYYVAPQVWAWRRGRIRKLARRVDRVAVILPFELAVYEGCGASVEYVGHPLVEYLRTSTADLDREPVRKRLGIEPGARVIALLPGSRHTELRRCLPIYLETARVLHARDVRLRFLLPMAPSIDRQSIEEGIRAAGLPSLLRLDLLEGRSLEALVASDVALLRRLITIDAVGMPNLIAGKTIVPEFLQNDTDPQHIASAVLELLGGPARERQLLALDCVRDQLAAGRAAQRAAAIAEELLVARD